VVALLLVVVVRRLAVVLLQATLAGVIVLRSAAVVVRSGRLPLETRSVKTGNRHGMSFLSDGAPSGRRTSDTSQAVRPPFRFNAAFTETAQ